MPHLLWKLSSHFQISLQLEAVVHGALTQEDCLTTASDSQ